MAVEAPAGEVSNRHIDPEPLRLLPENAMKLKHASRRSVITALAILATVFSTAGCAHSAYERHDGGYSRDYGYRHTPQVEVSVGWPMIVAPPPRVYYAPA